ncbi:hypothetical protein ASPWEDRAFT_44695 [Aspergillus wentii DTO 134E9]|uniref:Mannan endo-1,6-alpha-mannosidase n=1 Tax=Aspergillus wentii DTO 134E9 TaxID=1073089 RepID=A0A1L9RCA0_ASPWE|nr:uncharacterized protein ASPWEDRAFT_44695 [Aspergillus wentii DTO 134E9]KAI9935104.1 hypothetical protein MW887_000725 [Aspergillus wentii]OJJ32546.1 hypothetical protein ASPWEDRAFT_44695 [Aspergillus wentii DTO 134E9]
MFSPSLLFFSLLGTQVSAQDDLSKARLGINALNQWYNTNTGLWNTVGWWNGANCLTVVADLALVDDGSRDAAVSIFSNSFNVAPSQNPFPDLDGGETSNPANSSAWTDGSYDDDGWWALAWIAAYDITKNQDYLNVAIGIHDQLSTDGPTGCNHGGIFSDHNHNYVNAVTNELYFSVAAHLATRVKDNQRFIDSAKRQWNWFRNSSMINEEGTINDGLTSDCKNNGQTAWSYNQGVVLGGLVELNKASPDDSYLPTAAKIAKAAIKLLADANNVIHESCEPDSCDGNSTQFKGIFIRNLRLLHAAAPDDLYAKVIRACADSIWNRDRNNATQFGVDWSGPITSQLDPSTHSSAMDALVAVIGL